jgi:hypothetical protein
LGKKLPNNFLKTITLKHTVLLPLFSLFGKRYVTPRYSKRYKNETATLCGRDRNLMGKLPQRYGNMTATVTVTNIFLYFIN